MFRGIAVKPIVSFDRAPTADERKVYLHLAENKHNNLMVLFLELWTLMLTTHDEEQGSAMNSLSRIVEVLHTQGHGTLVWYKFERSQNIQNDWRTRQAKIPKKEHRKL